MNSKYRIAVILTVLIWLFFSVNGMGQNGNKRLNYFLHGTVGYVFEIGDISDYELGENDFPVTPGHLEPGFGGSIVGDISRRIAIQLSFDLLYGVEVNKRDPSDGEDYMYKTYNNINIFSGVIWKMGRSDQFFLNIGGGVNILNPYDDKNVFGSLGNMILLEAPDTKTRPAICLGVGVILGNKIVFKVESLFIKVLDDRKSSMLLRLGLGI